MKSSHLYIISNYKFKKQTTLERAQKELKRLTEQYPEETFRIYKVASGIKRDGTQAPKNTKHDIKNDYKNPPSLKGPTDPATRQQKIKVSLSNFKGALITKGEENV